MSSDPEACGGDGNLQEWREVGLRADEKLRSNDFEAVEQLGRRLCELRPDRARGWLLRLTALMELEAAEDDLAALAQDGVTACDDSAEELRLAAQSRCTAAGAAGLRRFQPHPTPDGASAGAQVYVGEWDAEGVYVYQAFSDDIADWAVVRQQFGGPKFCPKRMTWIKPSFAWVLYRSGYGFKPGQTRVLKIKVSHRALARLLEECQCVDTNKATRSSHASDGGGLGRVQWDPERDIMCAGDNGKEPRMLLRRRAIQIGLKGRLSEFYVSSAISIQDVTELSHRICRAHKSKHKNAMEELLPELPEERPYLPQCSGHTLVRLGLLPGDAATAVAQLGRGKARG